MPRVKHKKIRPFKKIIRQKPVLIAAVLICVISILAIFKLIISDRVLAARPPHRSRTTLSVARDSFAATSVGTKAIFAGGQIAPGAENVVEIYDEATNTWSATYIQNFPARLAATSVGTKAIFAGGYGSDQVNIYDDSTGMWRIGTLSKPRAGLCATTVGTKAIFAGGEDSSSKQMNSVDIYDDSTGTWSTATLSRGRSFLAAASVGTKAFFGGGLDYSNTETHGVSDVVDIYDTATNTWNTARLSQARYSLSATSVGTKVIFAGGSTWNGTPSDVVDIYDDSTGLWSTSTLSQARSGLAATTVGTKAFFGGGQIITDKGTSDVTQVVDIFDDSTGNWSKSKLTEARSGLAATTVGTKAVFAGGYHATSATTPYYLNVVDIFDVRQ